MTTTHAGHIALGTMYLGTRQEREQSFAILDRFVELGGRWLDTANNYAFWVDDSGLGGQSETMLGHWLAERPGMRDRVWISTKLGAAPLEPHRWPETMEGLAPAAIESALAASLERLGTDHVELLWAHLEDRTTALDDQVRALAGVVADGRVRQLGASNHPMWRLERARAHARELGVAGYSAVQLRHTLVQPVPFVELPDGGHVVASPEALDYVHSENLPLWAYSTLLSGAYARDDREFQHPYRHAMTEQKLAALDQVARRTGATRNQVVLAWLMHGSPAVTPIVGVSSVSQLDEVMDSRHLTLEASDRDLLNV